MIILEVFLIWMSASFFIALIFSQMNFYQIDFFNTKQGKFFGVLVLLPLFALLSPIAICEIYKDFKQKK